MNVDFILRGYVAEQTTPYTLDSKTSVYYYALLPAGTGTTYNVDVAETATGTDSGSSTAIFRVAVAETTAGLDASSADVIVSISFTPIVIFM